MLLGLEKELKCSICFVEFVSDEDLVVGIWVDPESTAVEECSVDGLCVDVVVGDRDLDSIIDKELDCVAEYFVDSRSVWVLLGLEKELICLILFVEVFGIWVDDEWTTFEEFSVDGICVDIVVGDTELFSDLDPIIDEELDRVAEYFVDSRGVGVLLGLEKELNCCIVFVEFISDEDLAVEI